jgi:hypothetical protein
MWLYSGRSSQRLIVFQADALRVELVAAGDPDQLLIAITASLDGLVRFGLHHPEQFHTLCPDASILLRMLKP